MSSFGRVRAETDMARRNPNRLTRSVEEALLSGWPDDVVVWAGRAVDACRPGNPKALNSGPVRWATVHAWVLKV
jgi:hypothetical protein